MISIWTKPQLRKAVMWMGDNEDEIKEFFETFVERNASYRIVEGRLEYINDMFPPNDVSEGADGDQFVHTCPVGNWLVREWLDDVEEQYATDMSPKEMVGLYLTKEPK